MSKGIVSTFYIPIHKVIYYHNVKIILEIISYTTNHHLRETILAK